MESTQQRRRIGRPAVTAVIVAAALVLAGVGGAVALTLSGDKSDEPARDYNPLEGANFYVNPANPAARQVQEWQKAGRTADAAALRRIADRPVAVWVGDEDGAITRAQQVTIGAEAAGRAALLTVYNIPNRDCGQYSAGGAPDADAYRTWIAELAQALSGHTAVVILEPDAVAHALGDCLDEAAIATRYALLRGAITRLKANQNVAVYLDAGNASWIKDPDKMVAGLTKAGVALADGFSLNVSNFQTTKTTIAYGDQLSDRLGGKHFVVDTSRNGNGPYTNPDDAKPWCNPPGRKLGTPPTTKTGLRRVDAFLWIKQPGESDGPCRDGAPAAGVWWPDYALGLAQ